MPGRRCRYCPVANVRRDLLFVGVHMVALLIAFSLGLLLVPALTSSILSGHGRQWVSPTRLLG